MILTTLVSGAALAAAAAGLAVRAHLLGGSSPGWPAAPWWVRWTLWAVAAVIGPIGLRQALAPFEAVGLGMMWASVALGVYGVVGAVNLARQRGARGGGVTIAVTPSEPGMTPAEVHRIARRAAMEVQRADPGRRPPSGNGAELQHRR